jgi:hypothetical protein
MGVGFTVIGTQDWVACIWGNCMHKREKFGIPHEIPSRVQNLGERRLTCN